MLAADLFHDWYITSIIKRHRPRIMMEDNDGKGTFNTGSPLSVVRESSRILGAWTQTQILLTILSTTSLRAAP
ncbi:hypothetical protein HMPREF1861_00644 [Corynebacterium kroppenstedtii]|nr:hypothetical protein HMPREF1861_00644 [Corynebacterium kroppenstedtii]